MKSCLFLLSLYMCVCVCFFFFVFSQQVGGEACKWGCSGVCPTPDTEDKFDGLVWPAAAAVAERLWSRRDVKDSDAALPRLTAHRDRLIARGVHAGQL